MYRTQNTKVEVPVAVSFERDSETYQEGMFLLRHAEGFYCDKRIRVAPVQMHLSTNIAVRKGLNDRRNGQKGVKSGSPTFMQCMKVGDPPHSSFNKALCGQCPLRETYARTGQSVPKPQITDQTFIDATSRENALHPTRDQLNSKPE